MATQEGGSAVQSDDGSHNAASLPFLVLVLFGPGRHSSAMFAGNFFALGFNHDYVFSSPT